MSNKQFIKLKFIAESFSSSIKQSDVQENADYPVYGASGHVGYLDTYGYDKRYIGIVKDGAGVGRTGIYEGFSSLLATLSYIIPRDETNTSLEYLKYSIDALNLEESYGEKATIPHIYFSVYGNYKILNIPHIEQKKLASYLDDKTKKIEQLISNQQQQIEKLKEYKQSLISEAVTKGLNPNVEFKDSGVEWIGKIPKDAQLVQLKRLAIINNGKEIVNVDGEIPVYGSGGIFKYTDDYLFQGESILYGRKGTIDKPLHVNGKFWTVDTMFYTEISELVIPRYLYYVSIGSINFDYYKSGSVLPSMTQFELGNVLLPFFDKKSQEKIIEYLDYKTSLLDKVIEQKSSKIKKLEEFKKSLIYEYVTGKRIV